MTETFSMQSLFDDNSEEQALNLITDSDRIVENLNEQQKEILKIMSGVVAKTKVPKCRLGIGKILTKDKKQSDKTDQVVVELLENPRWVSVMYPDNAKNKWKLAVVCSPKEMRVPEAWELLINMNYTKEGDVLTFPCEHSIEGLKTLVENIKPLLIARFNFLYDHRAVQPCCCGSQYLCIEAGKCVQTDHEMAFKCSYKKLMEREGKFTDEFDY